MKLTVLLTQPEFTVDITPRDILSCSDHDELLEMVRNKLKHALTHPKHFRVDPKSLMMITDYWNSNFVEIVEPAWSGNCAGWGS